jgi:hypothetical protein
MWPHFFSDDSWSFEVHAGGPGLDHRPHQLEAVEGAPEAGLGVGHDGDEPVDLVVALGVVDLVGPAQRVVYAAHHGRHAVGRIEALVRVHLAGEVGVSGHLPAAHVDRLEAGLDLLHGLVAGGRAQRPHRLVGREPRPQPLGSPAGEGVLDPQGTPQPGDVLLTVRALDVHGSSAGAVPAVRLPETSGSSG